MSEYIKDVSKPQGWKVISYSRRSSKSNEGAPVTAEGMDEEGGDASDGEEAPDDD